MAPGLNRNRMFHERPVLKALVDEVSGTIDASAVRAL